MFKRAASSEGDFSSSNLPPFPILSVPHRTLGHLLALSGDNHQARLVREVRTGLEIWKLDLLYLPIMNTCGDPGAQSLAEESKRLLSHGEDSLLEISDVPSLAHSSINSLSAALTIVAWCLFQAPFSGRRLGRSLNLQNGGLKPGPCFVSPLLSHASATSPAAEQCSCRALAASQDT